MALLAYVRKLLPAKAHVQIAGDCEFGPVAVLQQLDAWKWAYVMRQSGSHLAQLPGQEPWQRLDSLIQRQRQRVWIAPLRLTQKHGYSTHFAAYWQSGAKEPWLLATNLPDLRTALRIYRRRMWIEEMFGDFKGHGFDLESTQLHTFMRLSRLTLAVALLYVWLVAYGSKVIKNGQRHWVDRKDRRDLSIFRIGLDSVDRHLTNAISFKIVWLPYFEKLSGG
ncbi:MAG: transposase [Anaerolineae bacterium]|nr:transposase [Anaerolineae bacterium]